ncbi:acyl-CoA thioesterase [Algoriphagus limi]|uniref:Acyl-CoA thioesterase n=1 Tax=Algoriphagus limi TaxID=2975273 RepID=A0ABT2G8U3_9BACT|nr:thioesterase family protein [Algoriphagus limi]MCS5491624.1 acyl-CoA thioesterase [Algoriphagus limi]
MNTFEGFDFSVPIQVRFSDIDGYMHVNNGIYFNYFEHARAQYLYELCGWNIMEVGTVVARIELDYVRPIHMEDKIKAYVRCSRLGNTSFDLEQVLVDESSQRVFAKCKTIMVSVSMENMKPVSIPNNYREIMEADLNKSA